MSSTSIKIKANGKVFLVQASKTVCDFLDEIDLIPQKCVVEINGPAKRYPEFRDVVLSENDERCP